MVEKMDAGPIILQKSIGIAEADTFISLEDKLSNVAADLLVKAIEEIENNKYELTPQDENSATYAPKLKKGDGLIAWEKPTGEIHNLIRGCAKWPGAFTYYNGKLIKIYQAEVSRRAGEPVSRSAPGEIIDISKEGLSVACGKDILIIKELQLEGKRRMSAEEFIAGHKISIGDSFGKKIVA
jgi:methionyl-tRNA formyltransferase